MSTAAVLRARFPRATTNLNRYAGAAGRGMDEAGRMGWFSVQCVGRTVHAVRHYRREILRQIAQTVFGVYLQNVSGGAYLATLTTLTGLPEVVIATVKAAIFGLIAGLVGCYRGLTVGGGAKGLGTAVNETVVLCVAALFAINLVLTTIGVRFGTGH